MSRKIPKPNSTNKIPQLKVKSSKGKRRKPEGSNSANNSFTGIVNTTIIEQPSWWVMDMSSEHEYESHFGLCTPFLTPISLVILMLKRTIGDQQLYYYKIAALVKQLRLNTFHLLYLCALLKKFDFMAINSTLKEMLESDQASVLPSIQWAQENETNISLIEHDLEAAVTAVKIFLDNPGRPIDYKKMKLKKAAIVLCYVERCKELSYKDVNASFHELDQERDKHGDMEDFNMMVAELADGQFKRLKKVNSGIRENAIQDNANLHDSILLNARFSRPQDSNESVDKEPLELCEPQIQFNSLSWLIDDNFIIPKDSESEYNQ